MPANLVKRQILVDRLIGFQNCNVRDCVGLGIVYQGQSSHSALYEAPPPGELVPIEHLPANHPAVEYLLHRGFGLETMRHYGLSYCVRAEPQYRAAEGRIICPIDFRGVRIGWQGRFVGTPPNRQTPKYYTYPRMAKSQILYNFGRASLQPVIVVVEGITDVWRLGDVGVAIFGHDLSPAQRSLLVQYSGRCRPVLLLLDSGVHKQNEQYARELCEVGVPALAVPLPGKLDPADCPTIDLYSLIYQHGTAAGLPLDWETFRQLAVRQEHSQEGHPLE